MTRKFRQGKEEAEQILFFDYCRIMQHSRPQVKHYTLAFHIPNERKCSIARRVAMKRAGVRRGVPDICVPLPNDKYHSLYIEMKVKPNKPSPEQHEYLKQLNAAGAYAAICWSGKEAIELLEKYIAQKL